MRSVPTRDETIVQEELAGEDEQVLTAVDTKPKLAGESSYGPDDMTCAICLEQIQLENTAYVKGCEHAYCGECSPANCSTCYCLTASETTTSIS